MPDGQGESSRPLLVHGEKLRTNIQKGPTGGGQKFHPYTPEESSLRLAPQARLLRESARAIPGDRRGTHIIFQATLLPNYLAASYFPSDLFAELDLVPIGSRSDRAPYMTATRSEEHVLTKSLIVAGTDESLDGLSSLTAQGARTRSGRSAFEQLREIAEIRLSSQDEVIPSRPDDSVMQPSTAPSEWEAVLHPGTESSGRRRAAIDDETFEKWVALVDGLGGEVVTDYRRVVGGLTFVPVRLAAEAVWEAATFNPLRTLRPLPSMRPIQPGVLRATGQSLQAPGAAAPMSDVRVAVFDGGTIASPLYPGCVVQDLTSQGPVQAYIEHGSGVTGAILYGRIEPGMQLIRPAARVFHYRVLPHPNAGTDPEIYWVLDRIEEELSTGDYDIVHLSLGPDISVEDQEEPNRWTSTLDELAYEYDVLFVVAAGNNGERDEALGLNRVQVPADAANGLSVGACDRHAPGSPWTRVAYSAVGPGRTGSRIQPTGVQFGGTDGEPFHALMIDGSLMETKGTSFAAPLATHALARLSAELGRGRISINNFRAFAIHLAERHPDGDDLLFEVGHGRLPHDFDDLLTCPSNEVLVLFEDRIARDETASLRLPVPAIDRGLVELAWTLAFSAPTEPTESLEYTRATIDMTFRPHDQKYIFTKQGASPCRVNVASDPSRVADLYADGYTAGSYPASLSMPGSSGSEDERRDGGKWETLRYYSKKFRASSLRNPTLELDYLAREGGILANDAPPLDYTLVLSVRAAQNVDLYDRVTTTFPVLSQLPIETRVRAEGGES